VDISTALSVDLANLLRITELSDVDLDNAVRDLHIDIADAVPSFVGFALTVTMERQPVTLTSMTKETLTEPIGSSLALPLAATAEQPPGTVLVMYATAPDAFAGLAVDLAHPFAAAESGLVLDAHLEPTLRSGLTGVEELSITNRAIGMLMGRGHTAEGAREQLQRKASQSDLQVYQVAAYLISTTE
jgi:hypothetical protein